MEVGETWAYRSSSRATPTPVRVVKLGVKKPKRLLCLFEADEYEGKQEWLIPGRLMCPWVDVAATLENETNLNRLIALGRPSDAESSAIDFMEKHYLSDLATVRTGSAEWGMLDIPDVESMAAATGLTIEAATTDAWAHDGIVTVPLPTTRLVLAALARRHSQDVLRRAEEEESEALRATANGRWTRERKPTFTTPEVATEVYNEFYAPYFELLREWAGPEAASQADDTTRWKREAWRLFRLLDESIDTLRQSGQEQTAWQLHKQLFPEANRTTWTTAKRARIKAEASRDEDIRKQSADLAGARAWELARRAQEAEAEIWAEGWTPRADWYE